ncbi:hypothetical protein [Helicobacter canis]|nr:hypothetical protein [Helicobacter canis]
MCLLGCKYPRIVARIGLIANRTRIHQSFPQNAFKIQTYQSNRFYKAL